MRGRILAAWGEAWPIVEVDDANVAFGADYAVASIDFYIEHFAGSLTDVAELFFVEFQTLRLAVDGFVAVF